MSASPGRAAAGEVAAPSADGPAVAAELLRETGLRARLDEPLAPHTTMRVGGPADLFVEARTSSSLAAAVRFALARRLPLFVIGRGSDLVVADEGIRGMVILNRAAQLEVTGVRLTAASGVQIARAATAAGRAGLSGLEFGLAIPGSVGGAVWANAGAHGSDVAAVLEEVEVLRPDGSTASLPAATLDLSYRDSRFKHVGDVVIAATFRLSPASPQAIRARSDEIRSWRREHQPLTQPSAGSIFRNPDGDSAGRLVDAAGMKGATEGGATISPRHANFIVNSGGASASDVRRLAVRARREVETRFGIRLEFEVEFVGDWSGWSEEAT